MTCRMAAGQQKKRLMSSNLHEQFRGKKRKKPEASDNILNLKSHIDLHWDGNQNKVVAKKEQVGLSWLDMASFVDADAKSHSGVADVIGVPRETFILDNLAEVLSYEVWATCLSESERKLLTQFLPNGTGAEQAVQSLLKGDNHHFGNPFMKWSTLLCSGALHPDGILHLDRKSRASRRAYYHELSKYHSSMLEVLKKWKEKWLSSEDPEKLWSERIMKTKQSNLATSAEKVKVQNISKSEPPNKIINRSRDVQQFMSYIKISRAQYELIKNLKHSGDGIQSNSLARLLGDIKTFHVHPFEIFEEEESTRLHEHWLNIVRKDLPAAFEIAKGRKLKIEQWNRSLKQELEVNSKNLIDKDTKTENLMSSPQEIAYEQAGCNDYYSRSSEADVEDEKDGASEPSSPEDNRADDTPSGHSHQEPSQVAANQEESNEDMLEPANVFSPLSQSLGQSPNNSMMQHQGSLSTAKDVWPTEAVRDTYYHTTTDAHAYKSAGDLSLRQPQSNLEQSVRVIDLERNIMESNPGESAASAFDVDSGSTLFCSFADQDRNEMLPTFPKESMVVPSYPHVHMNGVRRPGLPFLTVNDGFPESVHFANQFPQQQRILEHREVRPKELFMHQVMNRNIYPTSRFASQGQFSSSDQQSLPSLPSSVNGGNIGYNWFQVENQGYNNWSGVESSSGSPCLGDGAADGSLYSVLNNKLSMTPSYNTANSEQYVQARNFVSGGLPSVQGVYDYAQNQLDLSISHETASVPALNGGSWMNIPHQNPGFHDSLGRPFSRPWNR